MNDGELLERNLGPKLHVTIWGACAPVPWHKWCCWLWLVCQLCVCTVCLLIINVDYY